MKTLKLMAKVWLGIQILGFLGIIVFFSVFILPFLLVALGGLIK